jgi:acetate kinase
VGPRLLAINTGSASVKAAVFELAHDGPAAAEVDVSGPLDAALDRLSSSLQGLAGVVHRVVHGGERHVKPEVLTPHALDELRALVPLAPQHLPAALAAIDTLTRRFPDVPQLACYDTAFHHDLPRVAQLLPVPPRPGLRRYGFHGLSCEYVMSQLTTGRCVVIAHLGSGASMTAVHLGRSVETTMGYSPLGGLMMGTRPGDLDPGLKLDDDALNHGCGLRGVSGSSADVRELLAREPSDPRAADALALFCHLARKQLGALIAVLGGLDTLVFTAGIGEHAAPLRARITQGLETFGISLDQRLNDAHAPLISNGRVAVRVMHTDEARMMARHARALLGG